MGADTTKAAAPFAWARNLNFGVEEHEWCACKHPFASGLITRDGEPWGSYSVESGLEPELLYMVALLDGPRSDVTAWDADVVRMWVSYRPSTASGNVGLWVKYGEVVRRNGEQFPLDRAAVLAHPRKGDSQTLLNWLLFNDPMIHMLIGHGTYPTAENWPEVYFAHA